MRIRFARKLLKNSTKKFSKHIIVGITVIYLYLKAKYVIISWTVQTDRMKTGIHGLKRIRPIWKISDLAICFRVQKTMGNGFFMGLPLV